MQCVFINIVALLETTHAELILLLFQSHMMSVQKAGMELVCRKISVTRKSGVICIRKCANFISVAALANVHNFT